MYDWNMTHPFETLLISEVLDRGKIDNIFHVVSVQWMFAKVNQILSKWCLGIMFSEFILPPKLAPSNSHLSSLTSIDTSYSLI